MFFRRDGDGAWCDGTNRLKVPSESMCIEVGVAAELLMAQAEEGLKRTQR